jgi:hypothetical protein
LRLGYLAARSKCSSRHVQHEHGRHLATSASGRPQLGKLNTRCKHRPAAAPGKYLVLSRCFCVCCNSIWQACLRTCIAKLPTPPAPACTSTRLPCSGMDGCIACSSKRSRSSSAPRLLTTSSVAIEVSRRCTC